VRDRVHDLPDPGIALADVLGGLGAVADAGPQEGEVGQAARGKVGEKGLSRGEVRRVPGRDELRPDRAVKRGRRQAICSATALLFSAPSTSPSFGVAQTGDTAGAETS
jgi:hypothetical protein